MSYLFVSTGLLLLLLGGEIVVRGAVALAHRLNVSPLIVGLTIIGFGTSLPELVVCVNAATSGAPGLAVGNVVGSNIANTMLVLGCAALLAPIAVDPDGVRRDTIGMTIATIVFVGLGMTGGLLWIHGACLVIILVIYIFLTLWIDQQTGGAEGEHFRSEVKETGPPSLALPLASAFVVAGLAAVLGGAELLVGGATDLAQQFGVPNEIIGLTVVAVGTSLPELATGVVAAVRGHSEVCLGNVLGSNLFNLFGIAGVTALFAPLPFSDKLVSFDLWVLMGTAALLLPFIFTGRRISRLEGVALATLYVAYVTAQFSGLSGTFLASTGSVA